MCCLRVERTVKMKLVLYCWVKEEALQLNLLANVLTHDTLS